MSAQRTSHSSQSLTVEFSSPPTYWIGFCTWGSRASSCGKTDSTDISNLRARTGVTLKRTRPARAATPRSALQRRPVLPAGGLGPQTGQFALAGGRDGLLTAVEEADGEGGLPRRVRLDRQLAQRLPRAHAVLAVAEQLLHLGHEPGERLRGPAEHRAGDLGGVAGPLGVLAGLVQDDVALGP